MNDNNFADFEVILTISSNDPDDPEREITVMVSVEPPPIVPTDTLIDIVGGIGRYVAQGPRLPRIRFKLGRPSRRQNICLHVELEEVRLDIEELLEAREHALRAESYRDFELDLRRFLCLVGHGSCAARADPDPAGLGGNKCRAAGMP